MSLASKSPRSPLPITAKVNVIQNKPRAFAKHQGSVNRSVGPPLTFGSSLTIECSLIASFFFNRMLFINRRAMVNFRVTSRSAVDRAKSKDEFSRE